MNVKNFKIGDSIQYQLPLFDPQEGKITKIYTDSVVINNNNHVSEKYIIKKVNKDKISIKDLKIGDRVKYKVNYSPYIYEALIIYIDNEKANVESGLCYGSQTINVNSIISKLEHVILEPQYKEIPVEEKENPYWIPVVKTVSHPYSIETSYHCPKCDKKLWGTCGMPIKEYTKEPCEECKNKEKPAPKSFKFNFTKTGYDFWIPNKIMKELEIHKEYTVEITEKK